MNPTNRFCRLALIATLFGAVPTALAQQSTDTPLPSDLEEDVGVHLVLIDTVVVDRAGRTVPDLTLDDFEIIVDGKSVACCPRSRPPDISMRSVAGRGQGLR